jgi:exopolysaccharide production protein ExoY
MNLKLSHSDFASALDSQPSPEMIAKRQFDLGLATFAIIFLLPVLMFVAIVVFLTQGRPIIYRQPRLGLKGKTFSCLKFRSMITNADVVLREYLDKNPQAALQWQQQQKLMDDPRITRFGMFLRRSSFDELPQLFNILAGDMSFVGPRPIVPDEVVRYGDRAVLLMSVRPGLTGLWQISGRSNVSYETRVRLDMEYIETRTLVGDLKIIVRTVPAILSQRGSV